MGAATAAVLAVLAVTTAVPTAAAQQPRPLTGRGHSYDDGQTRKPAGMSRRDGRWTATVDHAGAGGERVALRAELTDANGNSVVQTVTRAHDVR